MFEIVVEKLNIAALEGVYAAVKGKLVVCAYLRVSTRMQVFERYSLDTQKRILGAEIRCRFGEDCAVIWFTDAGLSGALPIWREGLKRLEFRPAFSMLALLTQQGVVSYVIAVDCSRMSRDILVWEQFQFECLEPGRAVFVSTTECIDTATQTGKEQITLLVILAGEEKRQINDNKPWAANTQGGALHCRIAPIWLEISAPG
jgi:DNA invertase Pin-like site-specific DNA recombinase